MEPFLTIPETEYPYPFSFSGSIHLQSLFLLGGIRGEAVKVDPPLRGKKRDKVKIKEICKGIFWDRFSTAMVTPDPFPPLSLRKRFFKKEIKSWQKNSTWVTSLRKLGFSLETLMSCPVVAFTFLAYFATYYTLLVYFPYLKKIFRKSNKWESCIIYAKGLDPWINSLGEIELQSTVFQFWISNN